MDPAKRLAIDQVASSQFGHITRLQLADCDVHRSTVDRWLRSGALVRAGTRTFRLAGVPTSAQGCVAAACIDTNGVASHWSAAWLHGLVSDLRAIDVTVPKGSSSARGAAPVRIGARDVRVHTSTSVPLDDILIVRGVRTMSVARTLMGLAAMVPLELDEAALLAIVSTAVDDRKASDPWLWWLLARRRCRGRNGVLALEAALAERARLGPTESWLEREFLRVLEANGVPLPRTQRVIRRAGRFAARVDCSYDDEDLIVEALGYAFHRTREQMAADVRRINELQLGGRTVLQFTTSQIVEQPVWVARTVHEHLLARRARSGAA